MKQTYNLDIKPYCEIYIENYEHSKALQLKAFELGFSWVSSGKKIMRYRSGVIIFNEDKTMEHYAD